MLRNGNLVIKRCSCRSARSKAICPFYRNPNSLQVFEQALKYQCYLSPYRKHHRQVISRSKYLRDGCGQQSWYSPVSWKGARSQLWRMGVSIWWTQENACVKVQKYYWFKYQDYRCKFCIHDYYGYKNITTGLCIATTGVYFDYLIITGSHILTTGTKIYII